MSYSDYKFYEFYLSAHSKEFNNNSIMNGSKFYISTTDKTYGPFTIRQMDILEDIKIVFDTDNAKCWLCSKNTLKPSEIDDLFNLCQKSYIERNRFCIFMTNLEKALNVKFNNNYSY